MANVINSSNKLGSFHIIPKLSDFILHAVVAAGFLPDFVIQAGSLRFSSLDGSA
jgi:hypothetical protein